jgi:hypothetical protein
MSPSRARSVAGIAVAAMGALLLAVGAVHFAMMRHLGDLVAGWSAPGSTTYAVAVFRINHVGCGVFVIVLGVAMIQAGAGLRRGERWARGLGLLAGLSLAALGLGLWLTVPPMFLTALPFRLAVLGLIAAGLVIAAPVLAFWRALDASRSTR